MMRMISGKRYFGDDTPEVEEEGKKIREILEESFLLSDAANVGDYLPILSCLGGKGLEKKLLALKEKRDVFFQGLIEQLRKSRDKKKKTMIEVLLSRQESDPKYYTDEMIRGLFMVISPICYIVIYEFSLIFQMDLYLSIPPFFSSHPKP